MRTESNADRAFVVGMARAFGGAIIFALPLLMTMEMWSLGQSVERLRLLVLLLVLLPMLVGLSHFVGFEETSNLKDDVLDAFVAFGIGVLASLAILLLFNAIGRDMSLDEVTGKLTLQAVPASIGALLARSELGGGTGEAERGRRSEGYWGELFVMAIGALFLAFNVAPTEEVVLIARMMTDWHTLALVVVSVAVMHAFVYSVEFRGQASAPEGASFSRVFVLFTLSGYAIALAMSAYILWTFGRVDNLAFPEAISATLVLGFPASIGAAAARLIL